MSIRRDTLIQKVKNITQSIKRWSVKPKTAETKSKILELKTELLQAKKKVLLYDAKKSEEKIQREKVKHQKIQEQLVVQKIQELLKEKNELLKANLIKLESEITDLINEHPANYLEQIINLRKEKIENYTKLHYLTTDWDFKSSLNNEIAQEQSTIDNVTQILYGEYLNTLTYENPIVINRYYKTQIDNGKLYTNINNFIEFMVHNLIFENKEFYVVKFTARDFTNYVTITSLNIGNLASIIDDENYKKNAVVELFTESWGNVAVKNIPEIDSIEVIKKKVTLKYILKDGEFFPWYVNLTSNFTTNDKLIKVLDKLQIFTTIDKKMFEENCFIYALKMHKFYNDAHETKHLDIMSRLKKELLTKSVKKADIKKYCTMYDFSVNLHYMKDNKRVEKINSGKDITYDICLLSEHYFIYDRDTGITSYFIDNFKDLQNIEAAYNIYKLSVNKKPMRKIIGLDSFNLVKHIMESDDIKRKIPVEDLSNDKCFSAISHDKNTIEGLQIASHCRLFEFNDTDVARDKQIVYFDVETYTDSQNNHIPYLCCYTYDINGQNYKITEYGVNCLRDMLERLSSVGNNFLLYAHNSTYDASFMIKYLNKMNILEKDNKYVSVKGVYISRVFGKIKVLIKDSWRILPMKLSDFGSAFKLADKEKECMYYSVYNEYTIEHIKSMSREDIQYYLDLEAANVINKKSVVEKEKIWWDNLSKHINEYGEYDLLSYARYYCLQDCDILKAGVERADELFKIIHKKLSIHNFYSLPSLAQRYLYYEGCYEDCYEFDGVLSEYFNNFVDGGRCMSRNNEKVSVSGEIQDFDAVSLYPSSMHYFDGFVKGIPTLLTDLNPLEINKQLQEADYYFITVYITKVNKHRPFPCMNNKTKITKNWTNLVEETYQNFDKCQLLEAIKWHGIEFNVISGYCFNNGFNTRIKTVIENLFNKRLEAKKDKNDGLQLMYKLMMNSSYGKHLQKINPIDVKYIGVKEFDSYLMQNYKFIKQFNYVGDKHVRMSVYSKICKSYSSPHMGCQILSYSKLIMNNVINTADDHSIDVFYQDTDSIHLFDKDVSKLSQIYKQKYNKELIGSELGQFHSDFVMMDEDQAVIRANNIVSKQLIVLGKKCYIDVLTGENKNETLTSNHIRMKGVSGASFYEACNRLKCSPLQIYEKLYSGESIAFNLGVENKVRFSKGKDQKFSTGSSIVRTLKF